MWVGLVSSFEALDCAKSLPFPGIYLPDGVQTDTSALAVSTAAAGVCHWTGRTLCFSGATLSIYADIIKSGWSHSQTLPAHRSAPQHSH